MKIANLKEQEKQWAVIGIAASFFFIVCSILMITPAAREISRLKMKASQVDSKIEVLKDVQVFSAQVREMEKGIRPFSDKHLALSEVAGAANRNNVEVGSIQPGPNNTPSNGYRSVQVSFDGSGDFNSIMNFFKSFEKLPFPTRVNKFEIRARSQSRLKAPKPLDLNMEIETIMSGGEA